MRGTNLPLDLGSASGLGLTADALAGDDRVDVWLARVEDFDGVALERRLLPEERAQAARYRRSEDAGAFRLRRWLLRELLEAYLGPDGGSAQIVRTCEHCGGPHGRPRLAVPVLEFSLSRSASLVAAAVSGSRVGVDVEAVRPLDLDSFERLALTSAESLRLRADPDRAEGAFYELWTAKEAIVKATGRGLAHPLAEIDALGALARGRWEAPAEGGPADFLSVRRLPLAGEFRGTVACAQEPVRVRLLRAVPAAV